MCLKSDYTIDYKGKEDFKHSASNLKLLTKYPKSVDTLEGNTLTLPFPLPILLLFLEESKGECHPLHGNIKTA